MKKLKFLAQAIWDQGPLLRFFRNFFITRNGWGLFHINSHVSQSTGKDKVGYNTKATATKSAASQSKKHNKHFSVYRCIYCGKYHLGTNRVNK